MIQIIFFIYFFIIGIIYWKTLSILLRDEEFQHLTELYDSGRIEVYKLLDLDALVVISVQSNSNFKDGHATNPPKVDTSTIGLSRNQSLVKLVIPTIPFRFEILFLNRFKYVTFVNQLNGVRSAIEFLDKSKDVKFVNHETKDISVKPHETILKYVKLLSPHTKDISSGLTYQNESDVSLFNSAIFQAFHNVVWVNSNVSIFKLLIQEGKV